MAQVIKYASEVDGKVFDTEAEQLAYDAAKKNETAITAFLDKHYPHTPGIKNGPSRSIASKAIAQAIGDGLVVINEDL